MIMFPWLSTQSRWNKLFTIRFQCRPSRHFKHHWLQKHHKSDSELGLVLETNLQPIVPLVSSTSCQRGYWNTTVIRKDSIVFKSSSRLHWYFSKLSNPRGVKVPSGSSDAGSDEKRTLIILWRMVRVILWSIRRVAHHCRESSSSTNWHRSYHLLHR
jgi:hypothetical protein